MRKLSFSFLLASAVWAGGAQTIKHSESFAKIPYGRTPVLWRDAFASRPSRAWAVDGNGYLRQLIKKQFGPYPDDFAGLLLYVGDKNASGNAALTSGKVSARFKKTEDPCVSVGLAARAKDQDNYYLARFSGNDRLELLKVSQGVLTNIDFINPIADTETLRISGPRPSGLITTERYREGKIWSLSLELKDDILTAVVRDEADGEQARVQAQDGEFQTGYVGLRCTRFVGVASFEMEATAQPGSEPPSVPYQSFQALDYPVMKAHWRTKDLDTARNKLASEYDVIVAGGGTGGFGAAIQAVRLGMKVLLLDETDWLGGQMACAGVTTMDEASGWWKYPVRERGIYREFHESMMLHYQTLDKDPMMAYYTYPHQSEGGYEPKAARAVMYGFIKNERDRGAILHVSLRSRVVAVNKKAETVTSVTVEVKDGSSRTRKQIACKQLIDATEYGDVIPLTGARYRSGNTISPNLDLKAPVQDHTWLAIVREYPKGVPKHLRIQSPPPDYEKIRKAFGRFEEHGFQVWGAEAKGLKPPIHWRRYFAWRGLADSASLLFGARSTERHTRAGFNGGNDYPVTCATLEDPQQRLVDERDGIYRSLSLLYYFQHELGLPWSLAEDEGFNTSYNQQKMRELDIRSDLRPLAVHMPQQPYVRESRRIAGIYSLSGNDLEFRDDEAKLFPTSVAMGDYGMDLDHGKTSDSIESDLDSGELARHSGPFMVPFEAFIPETVDGFVPAEKNISQSRRASGATRMQPSTMLTGQAAGAIAAVAIKTGKQPRQLNPIQVQSVLLDSGSTLVPRWHVDVPFRSDLWKATQLLSLYQVMDRPGNLTHDRRPLGVDNPWGVNKALRPAELQKALGRLTELNGAKPEIGKIESDTVSATALRQHLEKVNPRWARHTDSVKPSNPDSLTAGEFALIAARCLLDEDNPRFASAPTRLP